MSLDAIIDAIGVTPYNRTEYGVLYCADCLDILPKIPDKTIDLVLTDPPYGIDYDTTHDKYKNGISRRKVDNDDKPFDPTPLLIFDRLILWGGNCFASRLPDSPQWLTWVKTMRDDANIRQADTEIAWTTRCVGRNRVFHHLWIGAYKNSESGIRASHPTQKPIALMEWCLSLVPNAAIILDPFAGSGTTLVAAKQLGRKYIGVEINEEYCKICVDRLRQEELF